MKHSPTAPFALLYALLRDLSRVLSWVFILLPFDLAAHLTRRHAKKLGERTKVLILRPDALGDLVLWLDAAERLRSLYPPERYEITLVVNHNWKSLAECLPWFDQVWGLERKPFATRPLFRYRFLNQVRREGFDLVINAIFARDFLWSDPIAWVSGAPRRVGYHGDFSIITPMLMRFLDTWYTEIIRSRPEPLMELERNADLVRALGAADYRSGVSHLPLSQSGWPAGFAEEDFYLLVPGAGKEYRQWPLEHFGEIARRLHAKRGWIGIVVGAARDAELGRRLQEETDDAALQNWAGRTSLPELIRLVSEARLVISNETSTVHIAAALGTPCVSITGGGHYARYVPYRPEKPVAQLLPVTAVHPMPCFGCDWQCIYPLPPQAPKPCLQAISVETAWEAILALPERPQERFQ